MTTRRMSDAHEIFLVDLFGGRRMRGSGNQFNGQMDGRHDHREESVAFAWDGKSTFGKSIGVSLEMWAKAVEQSHGERPMLALRWYGSERLNSVLDLVAVDAQDQAELLDRSRELDAVQERIEALAEGRVNLKHYMADGPVPALVRYLRGEDAVVE